MDCEPATPRALAPPTTYDPQQGSLSDRTLASTARRRRRRPCSQKLQRNRRRASHVCRQYHGSRRRPGNNKDTHQAGPTVWLVDGYVHRRAQLPWSGNDNDPTTGPSASLPRPTVTAHVHAHEHALQQHEMQLASRQTKRQAHFEWEQRQMHQAAAQYKYAVEQDATAHTAQFKANLER
ncbi:hypothetical protein H257_12953 [Aphanomyces astaci]|uniref:Uncharacterized protein n=1 Tax=Aphanomyces astaci TaxID=112090 RepID=W4FYE1_APHAT|nr:hypothetical protein H257_12953 [Aphanomyces astaci]ETV71809.1 hypothetical protein H257_12953 [Aphanomyces astaci]|eukprot:XP_009838658.1 hypothetical protein H257_12953 [Aphanomyces astaci]